MALKPHEIPPPELGLSVSTARRWRGAGCDFSDAGATLAWARRVSQAGELRIQRRHLEKLEVLSRGLPENPAGETCVGAGGEGGAPVEPVEFGDAGEASLEDVLRTMRRTVDLRSTELAEAWRSKGTMERDAAQREFERATEALRKFEKDAVPILKSRGDLVSMAEVERALRSGLGRVAAALDGLVSRRPELADEVRVVKSHIVREPLLERCSA